MTALWTGPPPSVAICDPVPADLARTKAVTRRALDVLPQGRRVPLRAYTSAEALLAGPPCGICITEIDLGTMNGFALIEAARRRRPGVVPIIVTGVAENATALRAWRSQAVAYLLKPLERTEDLDDLRRVLDESILRCMSLSEEVPV